MEQRNIREELQDFKLKELSARVLAYLALFIALVAVATYLHIPGPSSSYFNMGEVAIYIIALTFGGRSGGLAGGLGASLVDMMLGYSIWAPFTLIIKGLEGWIVGRFRGDSWQQNLIACIAGGNLMVIGYAITKGFLISWPAVLPEIGIDYAQMTIGIAVALPLSQQLKRHFE